MRKLLLSHVLLFVALQFLWATPAIPTPVKMRQPDGSFVTLRIHGDEFYSWYTSEDGETCYIRNADGWWKPSGSVKHDPKRIQQARQLRSERDMQVPRRSGKRAATTLGWGERHFLVILAEFSDKPFKEGTADYVRRMLNEPGFSDYNSVGSAKDYWTDASAGRFTPIFDVYGPVALSRSSTQFPEGDDSNHYYMAKQMILESLPKLDAQVNFAQYDGDGDGFIDNICLIFPGYDQANGGGPDAIWAHKWAFGANESSAYDGVKPRIYSCSAEFKGNEGEQNCGIGTFCHEFGHVLGLPDLYDTDYEENGQADYPHFWNLMASGNHMENGYVPVRLSSYERYELGYITEFEDLGTGQHTLQSLDGNKCYRIKSSTEGEYFIPEVRNGQKWDRSLAAGLIIYHIDRSQNPVHGLPAATRWRNGIEINIYEDHPCDYILLPDPYLYVRGYSIQDATYKTLFYNLWTFPTSNYCDYWSTPYSVTWYELRDWNGLIPYRMNNIQYSDGTASFTLSPGDRYVAGKVTDSQNNPIPDALVLISPSSAAAGVSRGRTLRAGSVRNSALYELRTGQDGTYSLTLSDDAPQALNIAVFADGFLPAEAEVNASESVRQDFSLTPVLTGSTDESLTKAAFPLTAYGYWGYNTVQNYTVAQRFKASELTAHAGKQITSISFSTRATGEEVWLFIDEGTTKRSLAVQVSGVVTNIYSSAPANTYILDNPFTIPAGTDLYVGYMIKNANETYAMLTDAGPAVDGGLCMYYGFSTTQPGGSQWVQPAFQWNWNCGNALISFTVKDLVRVADGATLTDLGYPYIQMPAHTLTAGDIFPLKVVSSRSRPVDHISWKMDGTALDTDSVTLSAGEHLLQATVTYLNGEAPDSLELSLNVL